MSTLSLPILDLAPQRPVYAQGPRSLASIKLLRLSVTDRCNLRCIYCMPDEGVGWMGRQSDLLTPADFEAVAQAALTIGVRSLKVTGGEPTIRPDILEIVARLKALGPEDLSLTTNGLKLARLAHPLRAAGLDRLTVSCDSLQPERYTKITHGGNLAEYLDGVTAAQEAGFTRLKVNVVVMRGINDDEVADFAALTMDKPWTVRFIEYMPLGDSTLMRDDPLDHIVDNEIIKARISAALGELTPVERKTEVGVGPANVFQLPNAKGRIGFISAMSKPFCETCNRLRLTAIGELRSCLFDGGEVDLMPALRPRADVARLVELFEACVVLKPQVHSAHGNRAMSQLGG